MRKRGFQVQSYRGGTALQEHDFHVQHSFGNLSSFESFSWLKEEALHSVSNEFSLGISEPRSKLVLAHEAMRT